jgi:hypothetical protein
MIAFKWIGIASVVIIGSRWVYFGLKNDPKNFINIYLEKHSDRLLSLKTKPKGS